MIFSNQTIFATETFFEHKPSAVRKFAFSLQYCNILPKNPTTLLPHHFNSIDR